MSVKETQTRYRAKQVGDPFDKVSRASRFSSNLTTSGPTFEKDMPEDSVVAFQEKKYFGLSKRRLALVAVRLSYCVFQSLTLVEICLLSYEANKFTYFHFL